MNKLTPTQIEEVEAYLLEWDIQYQDFYEEMLDHFILEIESQMNEVEFDQTFANTTHKFAYKTFKPGLFGLGDEFFGPKAYEMEYVKGLQWKAEKQVYRKMWKQITTWRVLVWGLIAFLVYQFVSNRPYSDTQLKEYMVLIMIYAFSPVLLSYSRGLSSEIAFPWNSNSLNELDKRKRNLRDKTVVRMVLRTTMGGIVYFNIFIPLVRVFSNVNFLDFTWFQYLLSFTGILTVSYIWGQLELIWELTSKHSDYAN